MRLVAHNKKLRPAQTQTFQGALIRSAIAIVIKVSFPH
jgi:hypothetical protein